MIDSHTHLHHLDFRDDRDEVFANLRAAGVSRVLEVGIDYLGAERSLELSERYPEVLVAVGCHPHEASNWNPEFAAAMRRWATLDKVVAFGELGLDFYRNYSPHDLQEVAFRQQLGIAREMDVPVIFHVRAAETDFLRVLDDEGDPRRAVLHAFSHSFEFAAEAIKRGFWLGIGGMVTFPKSNLPQILTEISPERVLLETDCPWLAPVPKRGRRNEPSLLIHVLESLADIWKMSTADLEQLLDANFAQFTGIR
ncbi:MAG: TatD family hydrolase [bacterium]|nr:TatD family hydrolase [bacterium]